MSSPSPEKPCSAESPHTQLSQDEVDQAVAHLVRLINVNSTSGREAKGVDETERVCKEMDLPVTRIQAAPGRDNLLIGDSAPKVILCTHLDTAPPYIPATTSDTHVFGRGSADAKGAAVAMLHALAQLRAKQQDQSLAVLLVVGEETDHCGAHAILGTELAPEFIVLGGPCGLKPAVAQKGMLKLRLGTDGSAGHSAYPDVGVSAIHQLLDALSTLRNSPLPADATLGETTLNVGRIEGGLAPNVLAPSAHAELMFRCAAPVDAILGTVRSQLGDAVTIEELSRAEPYEFETLSGAVGPAVPFNTDAHTLAPLGARMLLLGPGDMRCAHGPDECLAIAELAEGIDVYRAIARELLQA